MPMPLEGFDPFSFFENIPLLGKLFHGAGGASAFVSNFINSITSMSELDMIGVITIGFALLVIISHAELLIKAWMPGGRIK